jgi:hypothetical protein
MSRLSRRALLGGLVAAWAIDLPRRASASTSDLTETLLSLVGDRGRAAALGESWINHKRGGGAKPGDLVNSLADLLRAQGWSGANDPAELRQRFSAAVRADYRSGETVTVAGWELAKTQAELCALAYFSTAGML